jgi:hypothetical protein
MLREWSPLPDAEHHLLQGLAWSRGRMMDAETLSLGYSALARVYTAQGRFDQAEAVLLECAQVGEDRNFAASSPIGCSTLYAYRVGLASLIAENMGIWKGR